MAKRCVTLAPSFSPFLLDSFCLLCIIFEGGLALHETTLIPIPSCHLSLFLQKGPADRDTALVTVHSIAGPYRPLGVFY
ncbi:hypothetical protein F4775DRAFT_535812 [Biscogniauxia sp. FL1348]|nr:hypothetical protein F4775DRAFT_535812 [Biscogniauxia sp. FL1348]